MTHTEREIREYGGIESKVAEAMRLELKRQGCDVPQDALTLAAKVATATAVTMARKGYRRSGVA